MSVYVEGPREHTEVGPYTRAERAEKRAAALEEALNNQRTLLCEVVGSFQRYLDALADGILLSEATPKGNTSAPNPDQPESLRGVKAPCRGDYLLPEVEDEP